MQKIIFKQQNSWIDKKDDVAIVTNKDVQKLDQLNLEQDDVNNSEEDKIEFVGGKGAQSVLEYSGMQIFGKANDDMERPFLLLLQT